MMGSGNMFSLCFIYEKKIASFECKYVFRDICLQKEGWVSLSIPQGEPLFVMTLLKYLNRNLIPWKYIPKNWNRNKEIYSHDTAQIFKKEFQPPLNKETFTTAGG